MEQKMAESSTMLACLSFTIFVGLPLAGIILRTIQMSMAGKRHSGGKEK
jgi:hypothetical protein